MSSSTSTGITLIVVAVWFMFAGSCAHFLIWRILRKREQLEEDDREHVRSADEIEMRLSRPSVPRAL